MDFKLVELEKYYDPLSVYSLFKDNLDSIFLDSARSDEKLSKYSFIGINPLCRYKCIEGKSYINNELVAIDNPFNVINDLVNKNKFEYNSDIPLLSGAIGYFSYDISKNLEEIKSSSKEDFSIPEAVFIVYQNIIIFDIKNKNTIITSTNGEESINLIKDKLKEYTFKGDIPIPKGNNKFFSNFNKSEYENAVNKLKSYIEEGHVYIANLTRRIWCYNNEEAFKIYEKLRSINGAPFSCYMNLEEFSFISSSPERFLQVKNNIVETRPIKGTRPRGKNKAEDKKYKTELINSEKDKSELLMIVDLQRNDLSKVCKINSVKVDELYKIEEYETVFHLVSNIVGELEEKYSSVDCMKACFPGGSITGAPKIRAMEIIDELEGLKRNIYTGSVGYFDFRGNCDFNIVIRSIIKKDNKAYFGVGSGITWDSDPEMEWFETIQKGKALMQVL